MAALAGCYINLDRCPDRDAFMQAQLARLGMGWVRRLPAADGALVALPAGCTLLPGEYGCFLSHLEAVASAPAGSHLLVLEDDAELADQLPGIVTGIVAAGSLGDADLLFLECQPHFSMAHVSQLWEVASRCIVTEDPQGERRHVRGVEMMQAKGLYRWGCPSYVLTPAGRDRLLDLMRSWLAEGPLRPLDQHLEAALLAGTLRGRVCVPFLTTTALRWHGQSSIGNGPRVPPNSLMVLRRLLYAGGLGDAPVLARPLERLAADLPLQLLTLVLRDIAAAQRDFQQKGDGRPPGG